ncbi:hypothetical protein WI73_03670 [Burkholderia ubonensis]|uniref:Uncharacterized protein n=1 Tax=Burkholderia ubonensis TaxID=101571 RepID=A0A102N572_9BURK|nr:hypothetical protein WI31_29355 [Burkholderia ubonensis]KUZ22222.1 hypothetical protein WI29_01535 [Burkholderia ubonensis]KUZ28290.1 hypothetical protein WI30_23390 [Burkholderia ubonensis]KUZ39695.1 hypothetical protein WI32_08390 [Burkholderia ubonensis]KUZ49144.1 hypothetical protein WI33_19075 [Burkholderia ubonensis]
MPARAGVRAASPPDPPACKLRRPLSMPGRDALHALLSALVRILHPVRHENEHRAADRRG